MEEKQLIDLLQKFLDGTATDFEQKQLQDWYDAQNDKEVVWETTSADEALLVKRQMQDKIEQHVRKSRKIVLRKPARYYGRIAAAIAGLAILAGLYFFSIPDKKLAAMVAVAPANFSENKFVLLPDSSTVLLHPGSKISYHFNGKTRQLTLSGEAYFDIKHRVDQAFVIRTGKVTTTVLGTAFNIKAYNGEPVVVSVTRGKVSVADEDSKMLAVLTPNQQVAYNGVTKKASQQQVKVDDAISWVKADMQFDGLPFKALAGKLSHRYGMNFKFSKTELEKCPITGRFNGTETLDQVLNIITETMGTTFTVAGDMVTIDGKGCL